MNENGRRLSIEEQAARIAREAVTLEMDPPTLQVLLSMNEQLHAIRKDIDDLKDTIHAMKPEKEWFTTADVASLCGVSQFTVQARWCATGRIECEKDETTGHHRIPAHEYDRLRRSGRPRPQSVTTPEKH